jgi:predicted nucleic acid-binding protein
MKVYLDTTVITLLLFGAQTDPGRHREVTAFFVELDKGGVQAVVSIYALQELCAFCYGNFSAEDAPHVARLAFHELLGHELMLVPLLSRADRIVLNRRFPMRDTSDQAHAATAFHVGCEAIVTYDRHYQDIADRIPCFTAAEALSQ